MYNNVAVIAQDSLNSYMYKLKRKYFRARRPSHFIRKSMNCCLYSLLDVAKPTWESSRIHSEDFWVIRPQTSTFWSHIIIHTYINWCDQTHNPAAQGNDTHVKVQYMQCTRFWSCCAIPILMVCHVLKGRVGKCSHSCDCHPKWWTLLPTTVTPGNCTLYCSTVHSVELHEAVWRSIHMRSNSVHIVYM